MRYVINRTSSRMHGSRWTSSAVQGSNLDWPWSPLSRSSTNSKTIGWVGFASGNKGWRDKENSSNKSKRFGQKHKAKVQQRLGRRSRDSFRRRKNLSLNRFSRLIRSLISFTAFCQGFPAQSRSHSSIKLHVIVPARSVSFVPTMIP